MLETYALYATELTDEERELGFELIEVRIPDSAVARHAASIQAVVYRFSEADQIVKMNVPVIGGYSYRHERLRPMSSYQAGESHWGPVGSVVFPTAEQAVNSVGSVGKPMAMCH